MSLAFTFFHNTILLSFKQKKKNSKKIRQSHGDKNSNVIYLVYTYIYLFITVTMTSTLEYLSSGPNAERWLRAHDDPLASIYTFSW